jgi:hypothetical protein
MTGQHGSLTTERWAQFPFDQQILMIGNEMNRAAKLLAPADVERLRACYERVLALVDLTVQVQDRPSRRRELLRWRDLGAGLYIAETVSPAAHAEAFRCLLRLTPAAAEQIPFLLPPANPAANPPA